MATMKICFPMVETQPVSWGPLGLDRKEDVPWAIWEAGRLTWPVDPQQGKTDPMVRYSPSPLLLTRRSLCDLSQGLQVSELWSSHL